MHLTDAIEVLTVALLRHADRYLLLQRSPLKSFAPGQWTGPGGHVEPDEYARLRAAALRELQEETSLTLDTLDDFVLRRALLVNRPARPLNVVLYYTGLARGAETRACPEGDLAWVHEQDFDSLDIIATTRPVLPLLIADMLRDPAGEQPPRVGLAAFAPDGRLFREVWADL